MTSLKLKLPGHYLKPGEMFFGDQATLVSTLLGSCVAVTMFSPRRRVGVICHTLLPSHRKDHTCSGSCDEGPRYVDCAIRLMLNWFTQREIVRTEIEVKVFGGSDMFTVKTGEKGTLTVGRKNIEMALHLIEKSGMRLLASNLGGMRGRKLYFSTLTGEVLMKRLNRSRFLE